MTILLGTASETAKVTGHWLTNGESTDAAIALGHEVTVVGNVVVVLEPADLRMITTNQALKGQFVFDDVIRFYT